MTGLLSGGRVTSRDGTSLGYLAVGEGPTVLCMHGALATGVDWLPVARLLADRYRFVLPDRRGHGISDIGVEGHTIALEVEDLAAVLKDVGPVRAVLAHSFGAIITLHAMLTPLSDLVDALVLYEAPVMLDPAEAAEQVTVSAALVSAGDWEAGLVNALKLTLAMTDDDIAALRRNQRVWATTVAMAQSVMVQARMIADTGQLIEPFRVVAQPALLVNGEQSRAVFVESMAVLAGVLPRARRLVLTDQGHSALSRGSETLAGEIAEFLEGP